MDNICDAVTFDEISCRRRKIAFARYVQGEVAPRTQLAARIQKFAYPLLAVQPTQEQQPNESAFAEPPGMTYGQQVRGRRPIRDHRSARYRKIQDVTREVVPFRTLAEQHSRATEGPSDQTPRQRRQATRVDYSPSSREHQDGYTAHSRIPCHHPFFGQTCP